MRACLELLRVEMLMRRDGFLTIFEMQVLYSMGLILGFSYFIPDITEAEALFLTTGAAAQAVVAVGLAMLPRKLSQDKAEGRFDYMITLPVSREAYLFSQILYVAILSLPGTVLAVAFGAWHYDLRLTVEPAVLLVAVLAVLSTAGIGVAAAMFSPSPQLTDAVAQFLTFFVLLFAPVLLPKEYLPPLLRHASICLPPTYVADALRGSLTDLPGTHLARSMWVMSGFAAVSVATSAVVIRRRG